MTSVGENRAVYAAAHAEIDPPPSRFTGDGAYTRWAARADVWALNQGIQHARDGMRCTCEHKNVSHGYPESDRDGSIGGYFQKWPGGSFIGMGACGIEGCACPGFQFQEGVRA